MYVHVLKKSERRLGGLSAGAPNSSGTGPEFEGAPYGPMTRISSLFTHNSDIFILTVLQSAPNRTVIAYYDTPYGGVKGRAILAMYDVCRAFCACAINVGVATTAWMKIPEKLSLDT